MRLASLLLVVALCAAWLSGPAAPAVSAQPAPDGTTYVGKEACLAFWSDLMDDASTTFEVDHVFAHGDWAAVDPRRVDALEAGGHIPGEEAEQIRLNGAIVAHLENIERNDGFKGFNQTGVSEIIAATDPRKHAAAGVR